MFIIVDTCNYSKRYKILFKSHSDLWMLRNISDLVTDPFLTFWVPKVLADLTPCPMEPSEHIEMDIICHEGHISMSSFISKQRFLFCEMTGAILPGGTSSNATDTLPSTAASAFKSKLAVHHTSTSSSSYDPIPCALRFSPFHPACLYKCSIQIRWDLQNKRFAKIPTSPRSRRPLQSRRHQWQLSFFVEDKRPILPLEFPFHGVSSRSAISVLKVILLLTFKAGRCSFEMKPFCVCPSASIQSTKKS